MKKLCAALFVFITLTTNAQSILNNSALKIGFYKDIFELIDNNPTIPFNYQIEEKEIYVAKNAFKNEKNKIYNIKINKDSTKNIGDIIGFSDGNKIYLKTGNTGTFANYKSDNFSAKSNFIPIQEIGIYTYFLNIENMKYGGGGLAGSLSIGNISVGYIINLKVNEIEVLSVKHMKKLLADEPDLLQEFNADKNRKKNFEKYIVEYNIRYKAKSY